MIVARRAGTPWVLGIPARRTLVRGTLLLRLGARRPCRPYGPGAIKAGRGGGAFFGPLPALAGLGPLAADQRALGAPELLDSEGHTNRLLSVVFVGQDASRATAA